MSKTIIVGSLKLQIERRTFEACIASHDNGSLLEVYLELKEMSGNVLHKIKMVPDGVTDTVFVCNTSPFIINNRERILKKHESYRDYIIANVYLNDNHIATARIHLRGAPGDMYPLKETVLHTPGKRKYPDHSNVSRPWYDSRWAGSLRYDMKHKDAPAKYHKTSTMIYNGHAERRYLEEIFDKNDPMYAHLFGDVPSPKKVLFGINKSEKVLMIRTDVFHTTKNSKSRSDRWPGMLVLTNLRLLFLAYRSWNHLSLMKRFEKLAESTQEGDVSMHLNLDHMLKAMKSDLPKWIESRSDGYDNSEDLLGSMTPEQLNETLENIFTSIDVDGDGMLSLSEFLCAIDSDDATNFHVAALRSMDLPICSIHSIDWTSSGGEQYDQQWVESISKAAVVQVRSYRIDDQGVIWYQINIQPKRINNKEKEKKEKDKIRNGDDHNDSDDEIVFESLSQGWDVWHRFSQFVSLHDVITTDIFNRGKSSSKLPQLPSKTVFRTNPQKRCRELNTYIQQLCSNPDHWIEELLEFLDESERRNNFKNLRQIVMRNMQDINNLLHDDDDFVESDDEYEVAGGRIISAQQARQERELVRILCGMDEADDEVVVIDELDESDFDDIEDKTKVDNNSLPDSSPNVIPKSTTTQSKTPLERVAKAAGDLTSKMKGTVKGLKRTLIGESSKKDNCTLEVRTQDGRRFFFGIHNSNAGSLQACRRGCDGWLDSNQWCNKLKDEISWLVLEDTFSLSMADVFEEERSKTTIDALAATAYPFSSPFASSAVDDNVRISYTSLSLDRSPKLPMDDFHASGGDDTSRKAIDWIFGKLEYDHMLKPTQEASQNNNLGNWKITFVNEKYGLCKSYPRRLLVPHEMTDEILKEAAEERSIGRIPTLTYLHAINGAPICRSSQPSYAGRTELTNDNLILQAIHIASPTKYNRGMHVVDARAFVAAGANAVFKGKGFENVGSLGREFHLDFMNIDNIHTMRTSIDLVASATSGDDVNYLSKLEASKWFVHSRSLLKGSYFVACCIMRGNSTLVHCSDGWDRTSQLCALAQILLSASTRTIQGFQTLIDKEFGHFGHMLDTRGAPLGLSGSERSPVLFQFLDCIYQLITQYPHAFEFTQTFLLLIRDGYYSRCFANFLGDNAREREAAVTATRVRSGGKCAPTLWEYLSMSVFDHVMQDMENPYFDPNEHEILTPCLDLRAFSLWKEHFLYHIPQITLIRPWLAKYSSHNSYMNSDKYSTIASMDPLTRLNSDDDIAAVALHHKKVIMSHTDTETDTANDTSDTHRSDDRRNNEKNGCDGGSSRPSSRRYSHVSGIASNRNSQEVIYSDGNGNNVGHNNNSDSTPTLGNVFAPLTVENMTNHNGDTSITYTNGDEITTPATVGTVYKDHPPNTPKEVIGGEVGMVTPQTSQTSGMISANNGNGPGNGDGNGMTTSTTKLVPGRKSSIKKSIYRMAAI